MGWRISSYWLDETGVSCVLAGYIGLVSIELSWCRISTGRVAVFPSGRERHFCSSACEGRKCAETGGG